MNPRRYRKSRNQTLADVAQAVGAANRSTVSKHERGMIFPSPEYIERYRVWSGGKVQFEDFEEIRRARAEAAGKQSSTPD